MKNTHSPFLGFSPKTTAFLQGLKKNNNKEWFQSHRAEYEEFLLDPIRSLVGALAPHLLVIDPFFEVRPSIGKTLSKMYRDTRFSRDKSMFRSRIWLAFKRKRKDWQDAPAYFFEISDNGYVFGMGMYQATPHTMATFRQMIDENPKEFLQAVSFYKKPHAFELMGEEYKKPFKKDIPPEIAAWYQKKSFALVCQRSLDELVYSKKLADELLEEFQKLALLYRYLWKIKGKEI